MPTYNYSRTHRQAPTRAQIIAAKLALLLVVLILIAASCACRDSGGGQPTENAAATATYGAEMYHQQLTALAERTPQP